MANNSILELIGNTPIVKLQSFETGCCELFVKMESLNPGGSIKDRMALSMIEAAERDGKLRPGDTIIEATAGNTGLGLALVSATKGYKLILVVPDKMSREKIAHLKAMGAKVILTRSDVLKGHPQYYQDLAESISQETPNSFYINQFNNPANPLAHQKTTAPEIWQQMNKNVDAIVCGVGSGGTITGLSNFFVNIERNVEIVLADPVGSILSHYVKTKEVLKDSGSWLVEGIGEDFIPAIADFNRIKTAYSITDSESLHISRELLRKEGIFAGSSSGTLVAAALKYCLEQKTPKRVVTFICDSGSKYLSKMFDDFWMVEHNLLPRQKDLTLIDIVLRNHETGSVIYVNPEDTVATALTRMKTNDISQLPVIEGDQAVGIIDELDLLNIFYQLPNCSKALVKDVMSKNLLCLDYQASISDVINLLKKDFIPIINKNEKFFGLITKFDLLYYLKSHTN